VKDHLRTESSSEEFRRDVIAVARKGEAMFTQKREGLRNLRRSALD
jgi:hypothetical protein